VIVNYHIQRRNQGLLAHTHLHASQRRKAFGATDFAIAVHPDHRLLIGVDAGADDPQSGMADRLVNAFVPRLTRSNCSGS